MQRSLIAACAVAAASAATYEVRMRDGVTLHTDVDEALFPNGTKLPAILERSPYGQSAEELIALVVAELLGWAGVRQDIRGTQGSAGNYTAWHDAQSDAFDTIDWIINQPWSNGQVFTTGVSADSIDEMAQLPGFHPALAAQLLIFSTASAYETFYPGGAYREALIDGWLKETVPKVWQSVDQLVRQEEPPGGAWWQQVNGSRHWGNVAFPTVQWAGWYDIFQQPHLTAWAGYQYRSGPGGLGQSKLVVDPLGHCQAGASYFPRNTLFGRVLLPLFMALDLFEGLSANHGGAPVNHTWPPVPESVGNVTLYVMGANEDGAPGQYWTTLPAFPSPAYAPWYMHQGGTLSMDAPTGASDSASYTYDPNDPVPTIGGDNLLIACGPLDQSPLESRSDVLVYTSAPLEAPLAITGEVIASLAVSTNVVDTDFVVKLIDVYPTNSSNPSMSGHAALVADGIVRMRWRDAPTRTLEPQWLSGSPTDVYAANVSLWSTSYVFAPGHSVRLHVTSSNWPRFAPHPNTKAPVSAGLNGPNVTALSTLHLSSVHASHILLPVVDMESQLPPFPVEEATRSMAARHAPKWRANVAPRLPAEDQSADDVDGLLGWAQRKLEAVGRATFGKGA